MRERERTRGERAGHCTADKDALVAFLKRVTRKKIIITIIELPVLTTPALDTRLASAASEVFPDARVRGTGRAGISSPPILAGVAPAVPPQEKIKHWSRVCTSFCFLKSRTRCE